MVVAVLVSVFDYLGWDIIVPFSVPSSVVLSFLAPPAFSLRFNVPIPIYSSSVSFG